MAHNFMHLSDKTFACTLFRITDVEDDEKALLAPGSSKEIWKLKPQRKAWRTFDMLIDISNHNNGTLIRTWH
jgi:hypothetical protein